MMSGNVLSTEVVLRQGILHWAPLITLKAKPTPAEGSRALWSCCKLDRAFTPSWYWNCLGPESNFSWLMKTSGTQPLDPEASLPTGPHKLSPWNAPQTRSSISTSRSRHSTLLFKRCRNWCWRRQRMCMVQDPSWKSTVLPFTPDLCHIMGSKWNWLFSGPTMA